MDSRRSSPITCWNLAQRGTAQEQAWYLMHFRADNIIKDSEHIRRKIVPYSVQHGRWSLLGMSYGGFCCIRYLSAVPEGVTEVLITGGIPPDISDPNPADAVYKRTFSHVIDQNVKFYQRYPGDVAVAQSIVKHLISQPGGYVELPSGSKLTPRLFQTLGCSGLGYAGSFDRLHYLMENAFDHDRLSFRFLKNVESWMHWEINPIYILLHESIYSQGPATRWAAHRIRGAHFPDEFDAIKAVRTNSPVFFTGEMVFPWMFDDLLELMPLKETAEIIAQYNDWTSLYDLDTLAASTASIASVTYYEDMFVDFGLAQKTVERVKGLRQWITNEYMHSGLKDDGSRILEKLIGMTRESLLLQ